MTKGFGFHEIAFFRHISFSHKKKTPEMWILKSPMFSIMNRFIVIESS